MSIRRFLPAALLLPLPALAHPGYETAPGFLAGFAHPLLGPDHLAAMLAVGLWAGVVGGRARWLLPAAFLAAMAGGAVLGKVGAKLPMVEHGILASVVILGALVAGWARLPMSAAAPLLGLLGLLHGHAHGQELGMGISAFGFLSATALLHLAGLLALGGGDARRLVLRFTGGASACCAAAALLVEAVAH